MLQRYYFILSNHLILHVFLFQIILFCIFRPFKSSYFAHFALPNHLILHEIMSGMWERCVQRPENIMRYVNSRTQHADAPTLPSSLITHYSLPKNLFLCSFV